VFAACSHGVLSGPAMERLETKQVKGHTYYYYSKWEWVDNRCRRVWQKYLGKLDDIVASAWKWHQQRYRELGESQAMNAMASGVDRA